jgi:hypothetical protein
VSAVPQFLQNRACGDTASPQLGQVRLNSCPQFSQNREPDGFSASQFGQCICLQTLSVVSRWKKDIPVFK